MSGASWLAQLIGLLSAWKQERKSNSDDHFRDFSMWLDHHNFTKINQRISESEELQRELQSLLSSSISEIDKKLDRIEFQIIQIASKIEGFDALYRHSSPQNSALSAQALEILKLFSEREKDHEMQLDALGPQGEPTLSFIPSGISFMMDLPRLVRADVDSLVQEGLLMRLSHSRMRQPTYSLTQQGINLANSLPSVEVRSIEPTPYFVF